MEKKKTVKKKQRVLLPILLLASSVIALFLIISIATGKWIPLKSKEITEEAKYQAYKGFEVTYDKMYKKVFKGFDINNKVDGKHGEYPYGLQIFDYGKKGKNGCLKKTFTASSAYSLQYGLCYYAYYMINEDYAKQKYQSLIGNPNVLYSNEEEIKDGQVYYCIKNDRFIYITLRNKNVVYDFYGNTKDLKKMQPIFNYLKLDFKVPKKSPVQF